MIASLWEERQRYVEAHRACYDALESKYGTSLASCSEEGKKEYNRTVMVSRKYWSLACDIEEKLYKLLGGKYYKLPNGNVLVGMEFEGDYDVIELEPYKEG